MTAAEQLVPPFAIVPMQSPSASSPRPNLAEVPDQPAFRTRTGSGKIDRPGLPLIDRVRVNAERLSNLSGPHEELGIVHRRQSRSDGGVPSDPSTRGP